jgi:hypothetical protein
MQIFFGWRVKHLMGNVWLVALIMTLAVIQGHDSILSQTWVYGPEYVTGTNGMWAGAGELRAGADRHRDEHTWVECDSVWTDCIV